MEINSPPRATTLTRDTLRIPECSQATSMPFGNPTREYRRDFLAGVIGSITCKRNLPGVPEKPIPGRGLSYKELFLRTILLELCGEELRIRDFPAPWDSRPSKAAVVLQKGVIGAADFVEESHRWLLRSAEMRSGQARWCAATALPSAVISLSCSGHFIVVPVF